MSQTTARRLVVLAGVVMIATLAVSGAGFRRIWIAAIIVLILAFFADLAPKLAGPFALIVALSVGFTKGGLLTWLAGLGSGTTTATAGKAQP